jgi:tetratricopeptide (TPR) repeat protein
MLPLSPSGRQKRWTRYVIPALAVCALILGGILAYPRLKSSPPFIPPDVPADITDAELRNAISLARKKVEQTPHSAEAWGLLGTVFLANGRSGEADSCLRQAEKLDRHNPRWPYYLALAHIDTNTHEAIDCLRRASELCDRSDHSITAPHFQLATLLLQEGRNEEAGELLSSIRATQQDTPRKTYLSALLLANRNDLRGSIALLERLTENPTARQKACTKLAQLHLQLSDTKAAHTWNKLASELPEDVPWPDVYGSELLQWAMGPEHRFAEVDRLQKAGRFSEAVLLLKQMIENNEPARRQAYVTLGNNLVHLGRGTDAEAAYEEALRLSPDDAETHNRLALVRLFQGELRENKFGDHEGAKAHYRRALASARNAVRLNPLLGEAQMTLGQILLYLGERQEGIAALRLCLDSRPEMCNAHLLLGEALAEDSQPTEARQHLENAVRLADRNDQRARQALERFESKYGKKPTPESVKATP